MAAPRRLGLFAGAFAKIKLRHGLSPQIVKIEYPDLPQFMRGDMRSRDFRCTCRASGVCSYRGRAAAASSGVIRRLDVMPFFVIASMVVATTTGLLYAPGPITFAVPAFWLTGAFVFYLAGPAAYVQVTAGAITVVNPLRKYVLSRSLLHSVVGIPSISIELRIEGGGQETSVSALIPTAKSSGGMSRSVYDPQSPPISWAIARYSQV